MIVKLVTRSHKTKAKQQPTNVESRLEENDCPTGMLLSTTAAEASAIGEIKERMDDAMR